MKIIYEDNNKLLRAEDNCVLMLKELLVPDLETDVILKPSTFTEACLPKQVDLTWCQNTYEEMTQIGFDNMFPKVIAEEALTV